MLKTLCVVVAVVALAACDHSPKRARMESGWDRYGCQSSLASLADAPLSNPAERAFAADLVVNVTEGGPRQIQGQARQVAELIRDESPTLGVAIVGLDAAITTACSKEGHPS